jgi:hypothetical protein
MPFFARLLAGLLAALGLLSFEAPAQDAKEDLAKQKAVAAANLKKAGFARPTIVESRHFIVASTVSETKARALGTAFDRVVPIARKALKFDEKDEAWKGKLAIYYLPEGSDFNTFVRSVLVTQPKGVQFSLDSDEPLIVDPAEGPANSPENDLIANAAAVVASAYLKARVSGAELPEWILGGFGRVTAMRAEGLSARRYVAYRSVARSLANKGAKPTDLWSESPPSSADVLANSLAEYLVYGPGAANFSKLIVGLKNDEDGNPPNVQGAFEAAGWKDLAMLDIAWRKWATTTR